MTGPALIGGGMATRFEQRSGDCPGCGVGLRWTVGIIDGRPFPGGPAFCEPCSEDRAPKSRGHRYVDPVLEAMHAAGVPVERYRDMTFDTWDDSDDYHLGAVRRFAAAVAFNESGPDAGGLYLHGTTGNGKTALAAATVRHVIEYGKVHPAGIMFFRSREFLATLTATYGDGGRDAFMNRARRCRLFVLDELGREPQTRHSLEVLADVIDARTTGTLVTSNYSLAALAEIYSSIDGADHFISRLGPAQFRHLQFVGPDRRVIPAPPPTAAAPHA